MLRTVVEARTLVAMMVAACVGTWGLRMHPVDHENLFLALIAAKDPTVFHVLTYGYATMWFSTPFFAASLALSMLAIVAYRHAPSVRTRALPPYPSPERRRLAVRRTWRGALSDYAWPRAFAGLADDPAARALHRNRDSRRCRYRQDVGLHVSVRRPASAMARPGSEAESRRARHGSERRLLQAGPHDARQRGTRRRLLGDRAEYRLLLQPAAQRSGSVRGGLRHRESLQQSLRQSVRAVLAAGVHGSAEVRHLASSHQRGLHDAVRGLPLHHQ